MDALACFAKSPRLPLLVFVTILLPVSVGAQPVLSVEPDVHQRADESGHERTIADRASQQRGKPGACMVGCTIGDPCGPRDCGLAHRVADIRHEQSRAHVDVSAATGRAVSDQVSGRAEHRILRACHGDCEPDRQRRNNAPAAPSGVGPQSTITCPAGAVDILPGQSHPELRQSESWHDDVLPASRRALSDQLDHAEDG